MSSSFTIASECVGGSLARLGILSIPGRKCIETPGLLVDTRACAVPHLTGDIVASKLGGYSFGLNLHLGHLIKHPGHEGLKKLGQTIREFAVLGDLPTFLSVQDPSKPMPHRHNTESTVSVWDSSGRRKVTAHDYAEFVAQARPDMFESLSDELQNEASAKRTEKSIRRSVEHLDFLIDAIGPDSSTKLFACVEGGDLAEKRVAMAKLVSHKPVAGFVVNGITEAKYFHDKSLLSSLLENIHRELPPDRPRLLHNIGSPRLLLSAIASGADLFDGSYLNKLKGNNLVLRIPIKETLQKEMQAEKSSQSNELMADVSSAEFRDCFQPIQRGCPCYTCANYTCAYLHHLQLTKEMLLPILIMTHNINQYQRLFADIRHHLKKQTFEDYQKRMELLTQSQNLDTVLSNC